MAFRTIKIDRKYFDLSKDGVHEKIRKESELQNYLANNLDSLYDALIDCKEELIFIIYSNILANEYFARLYNAIDSASKENKKIQVELINMKLTPTTKQIISRYSCRRFVPHEVHEGKLNNIEACIHNAPTALNKQELNIRLVKNKELIKLISESAMENMPEESRRRVNKRSAAGIFYNAPCVYLISTNNENEYTQINTGILAQAIVTCATLEELQSCIIGLVKYAEFSNGKLKQKLRWHKNEKILLAVAVGHAHPNVSRNRPHSSFKHVHTII